MKRSFWTILCICILLFTGCDEKSRISNSPSELSTYSNKIPFTTVNGQNVEWITMTGGLGGITTKVLFSGHDNIIIDKILEMLNENLDMFEAEKTVLDTVLPKIKPIGLTISLKDGNRLYLWPSYEVVNHSDGWTVSTLANQFILQMDNEGESKFYILFSGLIADYLVEGWKKDMPVVQDIKIESDTASYENNNYILHNGDTVTISGDGCPNPTVNIYIRKNAGLRCYHICRTEAVLGSWKWNGRINRSLETVEGEIVQLDDGLYDILINFGDREKAVCGVISLDKIAE